MTLDEKIGQLVQRAGGRSKALNSLLDDAELARVRAGGVGSYLHVAGAGPLARLQRIAVEESRLGIPLLFAMDVVHGYRTVFPVPLAMASSWAPESLERAARIAADEATSAGLHWTFAPMVDIARDPRWGRVVEGAGEDPYLGSRMAVAQVVGYQGGKELRPGSLMATAKHFGAYGAAVGGRDYNSADISERTLQEVYLPPFFAAARAGSGSFMVAFNDIAGVPTTANRELLRGLLRERWGWQGLMVSDWGSIAELLNHGIAADRAAAGVLALDASVDMDMVGGVFADDLKEAVAKDPARLKLLDEAVLRILRVKEQLGLFDDPMQYHDVQREARALLAREHREAARAVARQSIVLLKNDARLLPLDPDRLGTVAVVGQLATDGLSQLGSWRAQGRAEDVVTILEGITAAAPGTLKVLSAPGADPRNGDLTGIPAAVELAKAADVTVLVIGEDFDMSGESRSRSSIELPPSQRELAMQVLATGKPVVVVLSNGRPLAIPELAEKAPAILETWMLGVEAGHAVADVLFGRYSPAGRLPAAFPRATGAVPFNYSANATGRPADPDLSKDTVRYHDLPITPLYPFGHGLTYSEFRYKDLVQSASVVDPGGRIDISITVENVGGVASDEVVQLYVRDPVATIARPTLELRGFKRVELGAGASRRVTFSLTPEQFAFWDPRGQWLIEAGRIDFWIGASSADLRADGSFEISKTHPGSAPATALPTRVVVSDAVEIEAATIDRWDPAMDAIVPEAWKMEKLAEGFGWAEGPVWVKSGGYLLFTDVPGNRMWKWSEAGGLEKFLDPSGATAPDPDVWREAGANGLALLDARTILLADTGNRAIQKLDLATKRKTPLATLFEGRKFSSPNDVTRMKSGVLFFTDPPYGFRKFDDAPEKEIAFNGVYRMATDGTVTVVDRELHRPNGVALSPDESVLYVAQSEPTRAIILAYSLDANGNVTDKKLFNDLTDLVSEEAPGLPDGLTVAADGTIFATGPGGVIVLSRDGKRLGRIRNGKATANCKFGDDGYTLYLTSHDILARIRLNTKGAGF